MQMWTKYMKKWYAFLMLFVGIIGVFTDSRAEAVSIPKDAPVYAIVPSSVFSKDEMEQYMSAFYGDGYKTMKFNERAFAKTNNSQWRNDQLGYIAVFYRSSGFRLTKDTEFTIINTNMAGGYRDELQWYTNEGKYTYQEALDIANRFLSSFERMQNMNLSLAHVYYEDPSLIKKRCNYYSFYFVPTYTGIPISDGFENVKSTGESGLFNIRVDVTNEGIVCFDAEYLVDCVNTIKSINVTESFQIDINSVKSDKSKEIMRFINHPTEEDLSFVSDRLFYDGNGKHYRKEVTSFTPEWKLRYVTFLENGQFIMKPVWLFTAKELVDCEMNDDYTVMFDAENGNEIIQ
jgi:hypothetical protein